MKKLIYFTKLGTEEVYGSFNPETDLGEMMREGKTKILFKDKRSPDYFIAQSKPDITQGDDATLTKKFPMKAVYANETTCAIFEFLNSIGIPTAYIQRLDDKHALFHDCDMIGLEVIGRREYVGSFCERYPEYMGKDHRAETVLVELFLKTTDGQLVKNGRTLVDGLPMVKNSKGKDISLNDPFIGNPNDLTWELYWPKKPFGVDSKLGKRVEAKEVLKSTREAGGTFDDEVVKSILDKLLHLQRLCFLALECGWASIGYRLIDIKLEFGWTINGELVLADVIDNDSHRIRNEKNEEMSKQRFRDGTPLEIVEKLYGVMARASQGLQVPKQVLVLWRGSESDELPDIEKFPSYPLSLKTNQYFPKVDIKAITGSGHKLTRQCLDRLHELGREYPAGGVFVPLVGRSNGLGPILTAHTIDPVHFAPMDYKTAPLNLHGNISMPSGVPMATFTDPAQAIEAGLRVLAKRNAGLGMMLKLMQEERANQGVRTEKIEESCW